MYRCRNVLESYLKEMKKIAMALFRMIAGNLKIEVKKMEELFEDGMEAMRMSYYPPCPTPELVVGLRPHSDASGLTILNQLNGVEGLQVKKDGIWFPVSFIPDAFIVNVGDILEVNLIYLYSHIISFPSNFLFIYFHIYIYLFSKVLIIVLGHRSKIF